MLDGQPLGEYPELDEAQRMSIAASKAASRNELIHQLFGSRTSHPWL